MIVVVVVDVVVVVTDVVVLVVVVLHVKLFVAPEQVPSLYSLLAQFALSHGLHMGGVLIQLLSKAFKQIFQPDLVTVPSDSHVITEKLVLLVSTSPSKLGPNDPP